MNTAFSVTFNSIRKDKRFVAELLLYGELGALFGHEMSQFKRSSKKLHLNDMLTLTNLPHLGIKLHLSPYP